MQKCYTIYLGAKNTPHHKITPADYRMIERTVAETSKGYTLIRAKGYWKGKSEDTAIIVLAMPNNDRRHSLIQKCCARLRERFGQDAVLCQMSGTAVLLDKSNVGAKDGIKNMSANSMRTDWAKEMLEQLPNKSVVPLFPRGKAIAKLVRLKSDNPQASFPEARKLLKKEFPHLAKYL